MALVVLLGGGRQHFITPVEDPDSKLPACPVQAASITKPMSAATGVTKWFAIQVLRDRMLLNVSVQMETIVSNVPLPQLFLTHLFVFRVIFTMNAPTGRWSITFFFDLQGYNNASLTSITASLTF